MCGICFKVNINKHPVNNDILEMFDKQRTRGTEGFGIFDGQEMNMVHETKEDNILKWLVRYDSHTILFHHRRPTSTINVKRAAHPFSTKGHFGDNQYILVHNGHISNSKELKLNHMVDHNIQYYSVLPNSTFNDSESLLWDFALTMEGKQDKLESKGGIAFICLKLVKGKLSTVYFGRNYNPMTMIKTKESFELSSEGKGATIDANQLYSYNVNLNRVTQKQFQVGVTPSYSGAYNYNHSHDNFHSSALDYSSGFRDNDDDYIHLDHRKGAWVPEGVKKKFSSFFDRKMNERPENYNPDTGTWDYDKEGNPVSFRDNLYAKDGLLYLPTGGSVRDYISGDHIDSQIDKLEPNDSAVLDKAMDYMDQYSGHFDSCYWAMEADYDMLMESSATEKNLREMVLLEKAMEFVENDAEYINDKSVSSLWEETWVQQNLKLYN